MTPSIVVLTGAGISAESGIPTFRGPDGLWEGHRVEDVATPASVRAQSRPRSALLRRPPRRARRGRTQCGARRARPTRPRLAGRAADRHAECRRPPRPRRRRTGADRIAPRPHARRTQVRAVRPVRRDAGVDERPDRARRRAPAAGRCAPTSSGSARCRTTWTGSRRHLQRCDLFVAIGTSGNVYPAAGFVDLAARVGAATLELNLEPSAGTAMFDAARHGPASVLVPAWVDELLSRR